MDNTLLMWTDVETSGLDAGRDHLLEIAAVITDPTGRYEMGCFERTIAYSPDEASAIRANSVPVVQNMHDQTGLWGRLPGGTPLAEVDAQLLDFMGQFSGRPRQLRVAGNSVRLDLNFLERRLPGTYGMLHYRSVDVTALAYVMFANGFVTEGFPKEKQHSAMSDIRESIAEYRWIMERLRG